jgi:asparagine synthetase A
LTVYLAKQEIIPEFRVIFDNWDIEKEVGERQDRIKKIEKKIVDIETKLREESVPADLAQRLTTVVNSSLSEVQSERARLETLERGIMRSKAFSRSLGFLFYIVLGGVLGFC